MAFALLHQDTFNRPNRALDGDAMSDGLGLWAEHKNGTSSFEIVSNEAARPSGSSDAALVDSAMSAVGVQSARCIFRVGKGGPIVRWSAGTGLGNCYAFHLSPSMYLTKYTNGTRSIIGGNLGTISDGDEARIDADGSSIKTYKNSVLVHSVTDTSFATGKCGIHADGGTVSLVLDAFESYIAEASQAAAAAMRAYRARRGH